MMSPCDWSSDVCSSDLCCFTRARDFAHLVHGWAKSRARVKNQLSVLEVTSDLTAALSPTRTVIDGDAIPGMVTLEGPKAYRRDGWYWIYAPAGNRKSTRLNSSHVAISYAVF